MAEYFHIEDRVSCPFLPSVSHVMRPSEARRVRETMDVQTYYHVALQCAQSLWLEGKPAQALLQLNHALSLDSADVSGVYAVKIWFFENRELGGFLGNPVRHYQHLATRVSGKNKELRSWRAWACFYLARKCLPAEEFPEDDLQIERESLIIPTWQDVIENISNTGHAKEAEVLVSLFQ